MLNVSVSTDSDSNAGSSPRRLEEEFREFFRPKQEELDYVVTEEENKLLCKNFKVSVDLRKFNCLYDFTNYWRDRGSFKKRDSKECLKLVMKAYKRYKDCPRRMWGDDVVKEYLAEERKIRKAIFVRYLKDQKAKELASEQTSYESVHTQSNSSGEEINVFETDSESESSLPSFIVEQELAFDQPEQTSYESVHTQSNSSGEEINVFETDSESESSLPSFIVEQELAFDQPEQTSYESVHTQSNSSGEEINVFETESESESSLPSFIAEQELAFDGLCAPPQSEPDENNGESDNSLAKLQNEFADILDSDEMRGNDTEDLAQSVIESQSSQSTSQSTEAFYSGTQITSTQNSAQSPNKKA